jgi:hypothetical protein
MTRRVVAGVLVWLLFAPAQPAQAYLKFGVTVGGKNISLKWAQSPVKYFISNQGAPGVTVADLQGAVGRALASWQAVPTASISYQFAGLTAATPGTDDGLSTIGFQSHPELDRVLASTSFMIDASTGTLIESDIFFNTTFTWSVAPNGESGKYDLESIALHETGHLSGLGHSALGETQLLVDGGRTVLGSDATMFPIAFAAGSVVGRTLHADDIAGISDLYPDGDFNQADGSISGTVTKNGQGVFGAHIVAFDPVSGTMVANFTLNAQGQFSMAGLSPGIHVLRVEPLDDADVDSFFDESVNPVDVDFPVTFFGSLVVVPRGGDSGAVTIKVVKK